MKSHLLLKVFFFLYLIVLSTQLFSAGSKKITINEILASNLSGLKDEDGAFSDWIELYNSGNEKIDLTGWRITDSDVNSSKWTFPAVQLNAGEYLIIYASGKDRSISGGELHTNFSLSKDGEYLAIFEQDGTLSDEFTPTYPIQQSDISYGLINGQYTYFEVPTPGAENTLEKKSLTPVFSIERGYYEQPFSVTLSSSNPEVKIYYTTDGSRPDVSSTIYQNPINISTTTVLSALCVLGDTAGKVISNSYFFIADIIKQSAKISGYPDNWGILGGDVKYANYAVGERAAAHYAMNQDVCNNAAYSPYLKDAFLSIPTLSIVTKPGYLFSDVVDDVEGGIYIYTGVPRDLQLGRDWVRQVSMEYIEPATGKQFQINCGLSIHGAASRQPEKTGKQSFKVSFKTEYGAGKLYSDLFEDDTAIKKFDDLILRAGYGYSWLHFAEYQQKESQYTIDPFSKRLQRNMGQHSTHDRFVHLFLNGLYWGLYDISERINDNSMQAYFGGNELDYDVINHDGLADGEITAFNEMKTLAQNGDFKGVTDAKLLDIENYIDYIILNLYLGNTDWGSNNWYAARSRLNPDNGFRFFSWDAENCVFSGVNYNLVSSGARFTGPLRRILFGSDTATDGGLSQNEDFKLLFADRIQKHFFNNGALTATNCTELFRQISAEIDMPIILESARWGSYRKDVMVPLNTKSPLYTRNDYWLPTKEKLLTNYFPNRSDIVYNQLKDLGFTSSIDAPVFSSQSMKIEQPIQLSISAKTGDIYYTTDGMDPRELGTGNLTASSTRYIQSIQISGSTTIKARAKSGTTWSALSKVKFTSDNIAAIQTPAFDSNRYEVFYHNNLLNISVADAGEILLDIFSIDGRILHQQFTFLQKGNNEIQLNNIQNGVYIYRINSTGKYYSGKFIK